MRWWFPRFYSIHINLTVSNTKKLEWYSNFNPMHDLQLSGTRAGTLPIIYSSVGWDQIQAGNNAKQLRDEFPNSVSRRCTYLLQYSCGSIYRRCTRTDFYKFLTCRSVFRPRKTGFDFSKKLAA